MAVDAPVDTPADLRLAVAAVAAWLSVLATLGLPAAVGAATGAAVLLLALIVSGGHRRWSATAMLVLGCAGAAALATAARVAAVEQSPLTDLAERRASVSVRMVIAGDPRQLAVKAGPPRVLVSARVEEVTAAGRTWSLSGRLLVLAPADRWDSLLPSEHVRAQGRLGPPSRGDLTVAVLAVRSGPTAIRPPSGTQIAAGRIRGGFATRQQCCRRARADCFRGWSSGTPAAWIPLSPRTSRWPGCPISRLSAEPTAPS